MLLQVFEYAKNDNMKNIQILTDESCNFKFYEAKKKDNTNSYEVIDLFEELMNENTVIYFEIESSKEVLNIRPKFMIFQQSKFVGFENSILISANIINKYNDLLLTLKQFEKNSTNENILNSFELELIKAYDKQKDIRILDFAQKTNEFLMNIQGKNDVNIINYYQIEYRKRNLTQEEMQELVLLKNSTNENMAKAAICILLKYKLEYEILYNNFNDETKQFFNTLPIYNLIGNIEKEEQ